MKLYLLERSKGNSTFKLICANYKTVLDAMSGLDGTDDDIHVYLCDVADMFNKSKSTK